MQYLEKIVNKNKTEIITMKHNNLDNLKFKKLGSILAMKEEIRNRKALSMAAMNKLWKLWKKKADFKKKSKIIQCLHIANSTIQLWYLVIDKN